MKNAIVFFLVVLISCVALSSTASAATNLIVFVADDLGWGDVGYHGSEINTPSIDQLAAAGMRLERFYVHPLCSPTRGALLTGRSPIRTGVLLPFEPWYSTGPPLDEKFLPEYLGEFGYQTFAVGKWHLGPNHLSFHPRSRGFDHYYGHLGGFINYNLHTIWRGVDWQRNGETVIEEGYSTRLITEEAIRLIQTRDPDSPMFLYVAFNAPHSPLQAPDEAVTEYNAIMDPDRRVYAAMVSEMDRGIGQVLATLDDEEIADETLILFMSDNGGSERLGASNGKLRGGKGTTWEGGIRVPAVLRWPEHLEAGSTYDEIISVEDLLPTVLNALEISPDYARTLDGSDLWPALATGQPTEDHVRVMTRHNRTQYSIAVFQDEWKLVGMPDATGKLQSHLFRMADDPYEQDDLATQYPDVVDRLLSSFRQIPQAPIVGLNDPPGPARTEPGGPAALMPDNRPPNRDSYAESALRD